MAMDLKEIEKLIRRTSAVEVIGFNEDAITLVGIKLEVSSPLVGRSIKNVKLAGPTYFGPIIKKAISISQ